MKRIFIIFLVASFGLFSYGQSWMHSANNTFDGKHRNDITASLGLGQNTVTDFFMGPAVFYHHYFSKHWSVAGATEWLGGKEKFGVYAKGAYCLPIKWYNLHFSSKAMFNRYHKFRVSEWAWNVSATAEHNYFDLTLGLSLINYRLLNDSYTEPLTMTFGVAGHIRPRSNPWNFGLFFRNYEDFYYENWNINWGIDAQARINQRLRLYFEFVIRPAGSFNQLATHYETAFHASLRYTW